MAGMEQDLASGNHYDHARYYRGPTGRFNAPDLLSGSAGDAESWNRYTYARNNPLKYVDPDGNATALAEALAGAFERAGAALQSAGAALNGGGATGVALDTALSSAGGLIGGAGDMFRVGDAVGDAIGSGADGDEMLRAAAADTGRASALALTMAAPFSGVGRTSVADELAAKAGQVHGTLDPIAQAQRTTAVLRSNVGDIVAGGGRDLTPAQRALVARNGDVAARLPGAHAEVTALQRAKLMGATPKALTTTRPFCPTCMKVITDANGKVISRTFAEW
ncbi:MAG: hypothetical protein DYG91_14790 [Chloroflexi bacterium CFX7]|nr:MAG: hypothetical protein EDX89_24545 [Acidobacteriota bacterium]MCE7929739.1 hypothetical protein [Chloroflexi bacterium CFX7]